MSERESQQADAALLASFGRADDLFSAVTACRRRNWKALEIYTPFPVDGLLEDTPSRIPWLALIVAIVLALSLLLMQIYSAVIDYPFIAGGKALLSLPAFAVIAGIMAMLGGVLGSFAGMIAGNRFPELYHQVFNAESFGCDAGAFWLMLYPGQKDMDPDNSRALLLEAGADSLQDVQP